MRLRPKTPCIRVSTPSSSSRESLSSSIVTKASSTNNNFLKNFQNFMKTIIDNQNDVFLNGDKNVIKYTLSQYLNIPEDELASLTKLSIIISNDYGLLNQFGKFLPKLEILKLNTSNILSFNDIGTNFNHIKCLQMRSCHLKDINGLICMQSIEILDVEDNEISDVIDIEMCSTLQKINLKSNKISDESNLTFLSSIDCLKYLNIKDNPICIDERIGDVISNEFRSDIRVVWKESDNDIDIVKEFDEGIVIDDNKIHVHKEEEEKPKEENIEKKEEEHNIKTMRIMPLKKTKILIDASNTNVLSNTFNKSAKINDIISSKEDNPLFKSLLVKKTAMLKPIKLLHNNSQKDINDSNGITNSETKRLNHHCQIHLKPNSMLIANKTVQPNRKIFLLKKK